MANAHLIIVTIAFMVLDIITGLLKAIKTKDVRSQCLRTGLYHKAGFLATIVAAQLLEYAAGLTPQIHLDVPLTIAVCAYVILTEVVSIAENVKVLTPEAGGAFNLFPQHSADVDGKPVLDPVDHAPQDDTADENGES